MPIERSLTTSHWEPDTSDSVRDMTLGEALREVAEAVPDRPALIEGITDRNRLQRWTYGELLRDAEQAARALLGRFDPGERVAVWAPNIPVWTILEYAMGLAGITLVTVNPAFRAEELKYVLRQSDCAGIIYTREFRGNPMERWLEEVRPELPALREVIPLDTWTDFNATAAATQPLPLVSPDDPAQIQYTSGTTGFPKGAMLHHRGIVNVSRFSSSRLGADDGEVVLNPLPMFHTGGCVCATLTALWVRGPVIQVPRFDPGLLLQLIEQEGANIIECVPTILIGILEHEDLPRRRVSSLKRIVTGGATVPPDLVRRLERVFGATVNVSFGQTESSPNITQSFPDDSPEDKATTIGQPLPNLEAKIVSSKTGATVDVGHVGELLIRGYQVMKGYYNMPAATAETIDADGWLRTGDLCSMDARGYLQIAGRVKDMIIRGGENIFPREIEEMLFDHPSVEQAAVVGLPDDRYGESVAAFVRARVSTLTGDELIAYSRERLAPHKTPTTWVFVDEFPLTPSGKIRKIDLRDLYLSGALDARIERRE